MIPPLEITPELAELDLGTPQPKPTTIEGNQVEAAKTLWTSADGKVEVGVWECSPGRFSAVRDTNSEICHIISGRVTMRGQGDAERKLGPGDLLVLPQGWRGEWILHEKTRKLYVIHRS